MSIIDIASVPDVHVPFHDPYAFELALTVLEAEQPKEVVVLGDFGDFHAVARHPKKFGRAQHFPSELAKVREAARALVSATPKSRRVWLQGNHEESFERYVAWNAAQLEEVVPSGRELLQIPARDAWLPYGKSYVRGVVKFTHDEGPSGKSAVQQTLDSAQHNVVFGHTHRAGLAWDGNTSGERHFAMACGWLGDPSKITYLKPAQMRGWQHGLGWVRMDTRSGLVWPRFIPFVPRGGKLHALVGGNQYSVRVRRAA